MLQRATSFVGRSGLARWARLGLLAGGVALVGWELVALPTHTADDANTIDELRAGALRSAGRVQLPLQAGMVRLPGGKSIIGADHPSALPPMHCRLDPFWLDATPVTNRQFAAFVEATGYRTTAERRGYSLVFEREARDWKRVAGADWQHPQGPNSSIVAREDWPVVQVSWFDAVAYTRWAGMRLPTEAEYEYAARGGLADCNYPWGRDLHAGGRYWANSWQGRFPDFDRARDGHAGISPVHAFPENRFGLYDMLGNVWCWCGHEDDTSPQAYPQSQDRHLEDARVQRGGSWLSAENHQPLAVWRRKVVSASTATNHAGFRCASDEPPAGLAEQLANGVFSPYQ